MARGKKLQYAQVNPVLHSLRELSSLYDSYFRPLQPSQNMPPALPAEIHMKCLEIPLDGTQLAEPLDSQNHITTPQGN